MGSLQMVSCGPWNWDMEVPGIMYKEVEKQETKRVRGIKRPQGSTALLSHE